MAVKAKKVTQLPDGIANKESLEVFTDKDGKMFKRPALGRQDYSFETDAYLPIPRQAPSIVNIEGDLTGIGHDLPVDAVLSYLDEAGNYFRVPIEIELQGASSLSYPKKNYSIDLINNVDGDDFELKFGHWVKLSSFHLKANYVDSTHAKNICIARLYEQAQQTRPYSSRYPWSKPASASTKDDLKSRRSTGAMGHIDGFAIEVRMNGVFHGLYTWNISKNRDNYMLEKNNPSQIQLEASTFPPQSTFDPAWWGIRNPKSPTDETITAINRVFNWMAGLGSNDTARFAAEAENYLSKAYQIDYYLWIWLFRMDDNIVKNMQFLTPDGLIWYSLPYDMDSSLGIMWNGAGYWTPDQNAEYDNAMYTNKSWPWEHVIAAWFDDIKARYHELRSTVLHPDNVEKVFVDFVNTIPYSLYKKDEEKWTALPSSNNTLTSVQYICDWYRARIALIDPQMDYDSNPQALLL